MGKSGKFDVYEEIERLGEDPSVFDDLSKNQQATLVTAFVDAKMHDSEATRALKEDNIRTMISSMKPA